MQNESNIKADVEKLKTLVYRGPAAPSIKTWPQISIRLPEELIRLLDVSAGRLSMSRNEHIFMLLKMAVLMGDGVENNVPLKDSFEDSMRSVLKDVILGVLQNTNLKTPKATKKKSQR